LVDMNLNDHVRRHDMIENLDVNLHFICKIVPLKNCMNEFTKIIWYWKYALCSYLCKNMVILNAIIKINSLTSNILLTQVYTINYKKWFPWATSRQHEMENNACHSHSHPKKLEISKAHSKRDKGRQIWDLR